MIFNLLNAFFNNYRRKGFLFSFPSSKIQLVNTGNGKARTSLTGNFTQMNPALVSRCSNKSIMLMGAGPAAPLALNQSDYLRLPVVGTKWFTFIGVSTNQTMQRPASKVMKSREGAGMMHDHHLHI